MSQRILLILCLIVLSACGLTKGTPETPDKPQTFSFDESLPQGDDNPLPPDAKYLCTAHFNFTALIPKWAPDNQKVYVVAQEDSNHYNYDDGDCPAAGPSLFAFPMTYINYFVPPTYPSEFAGTLLEAFYIKGIALYGTWGALDFQSLLYKPSGAITDDCLAIATIKDADLEDYDPSDPAVAGLVPPTTDFQVLSAQGDVTVGSKVPGPAATYDTICGSSWM